MATLEPDNYTLSFEDLCCAICWDDFEDPEIQLASGLYKTCAGEWRREADGRWRYWKDPIIMAELLAVSPRG